MIKVDNIKLKVGFTSEDVKNAVSKNLKISINDVKEFEFVKLSIDARKKPNVCYVASIAVALSGKLENRYRNLKYVLDRSVLKYEKKTLPYSPIVVGFGPAGMFCALMLARMGLKPIIVEQGEEVDKREISVRKFWESGALNKYSNVQFGEGGAGTFSDGKLNSNLNSSYCKYVLNEFYYHGAPKEILYTAKPHIGSDNLKDIVKSIRKEIISLGGKFHFSCKFTGFGGNISSGYDVNIYDIVKNITFILSTKTLVLALGHSARDTFSMLNDMKIKMAQKPFAMGVRIEHKQEMINQAQYGKDYDKHLPNADYKLVEHLPNGRSVFTFCMCPGGEVVASSSNDGEIVTNGMSYFSRDKVNANSALLVNVTPDDFESDDVLAGVRFQEKYERLAFQLGGGNFVAPCESVGSFLGRSNASIISPTYRPNVKHVKIKECLPQFVYESIKDALPLLDKKIKGFARSENIMTAIESRSSSPITILRDENFQSSIKGIYPIGEGAGYAGGIMTSAVDGIKAAESIYKNI